MYHCPSLSPIGTCLGIDVLVLETIYCVFETNSALRLKIVNLNEISEATSRTDCSLMVVEQYI